MTNNLPFVIIDERLSAVTGFKPGEQRQTHEIVKAFWKYIKDQNLKV